MFIKIWGNQFNPICGSRSDELKKKMLCNDVRMGENYKFIEDSFHQSILWVFTPVEILMQQSFNSAITARGIVLQ